MTGFTPEIEAAACLSRVASYFGCGVTPSRFLSLIHNAEEEASIIERIRRAWVKQFPLGRCSLLVPDPQALGMQPIVAINPQSYETYLVFEPSGSGLTLKNSHGEVIVQKDGFEDWAFFSLETGRSNVDQESAEVSAFSWFRMAFISHRVVFRDVAVASALISLLALCASIYTMQIYDRVVPTGSLPTLLVLTIGVILGLLLEAAGRYIKATLINRSAEVLDKEISQIFFDHALRMRLDKRPDSVGSLASQLKGFETVRTYMTNSFLYLFADLPFALLFLLVIFWLGGLVALVPLTLLAVSATLGWILQGSVERNAKQSIEHAHRRDGLLVETLEGAEALKATGGGASLSRRWSSLMAIVLSSERKMKETTALATNFSQALQQLSYVGIVAVGSFMVTEGSLTLGSLIACSILGGKSLGPISHLPQILTQAKQAKLALAGLDQLNNVPTDSEDGDFAQVPELILGHLRLDHVSFSYQQEMDFLSVPDLRISSGERVAILGPTGSGKTSLIRIMSGIYRPSEGRVFLDNYDMTHLLSTYLRNCVRYVPQEVKLFSGSLRDNLKLGLPMTNDDELMVACEKSGLIKLIMEHPDGLNLTISESGAGLSGGQRQLVALTRVLLGSPRVILLDEPTSGMDRATERQVIDSIFKVSGDDVTIVVVTHKNTMLDYVDRVVILDHGRVVCDGPRSDVVRQLSKSSRVAD